MHLYKVAVDMDNASSARIALDNAMTVGELTDQFDKDCGAITNVSIELLKRNIRQK